MNTRQLMADLRQRGVEFTVVGDSLRYSAPKGVLTSELRSALVQNKGEIIAMLRGHRNGKAATHEPVQGKLPDVRRQIDARRRADAVRPVGSGEQTASRRQDVGHARPRDAVGVRVETPLPTRPVPLEPTRADEHALVPAKRTPAAHVPLSPCYWCGGRRFARSIYGPVVCVTCHPVVNPDLIAEIVTVPPTAVGGAWPDAIASLGTKQMIGFSPCSNCGTGTWIQYGSKARCQRCAVSWNEPQAISAVSAPAMTQIAGAATAEVILHV